jgi:hypothetical protein
MKTLLFVDTNILLDFYRVRNQVSIEFLDQLEKIAETLISTYQVEMEFKKNRQAAIIEGSQNLKAPNNIPRPPILSEDRSYCALEKDIKKAGERVKALNDRLDRILEDPARNDSVYKILQRIFKKTDALSLHRGTSTARSIRRLACKRFVLGYPPRKKNDTSTGDAVNWEWIVDCAKRESANVVIVTRDSDYGVERGDKAHINDWLREEFKDRVSKKASIKMTPKLSEALRILKVPVSKAAEKAENRLISILPKDEPKDFIKHLRSLNKEELESEIDEILSGVVDDIVDDDSVASVTAETNATGWGLDEYSVESIVLDTDPVEVHINYSASGDQDEDAASHGTEIHGEAVALIDHNGNVKITDVSAAIDSVDDDSDEQEAQFESER